MSTEVDEVDGSRCIQYFFIILETIGLSCKDCVGNCTDGASSMVGFIKGFATFVKQQYPDIIYIRIYIMVHILI